MKDSLMPEQILDCTRSKRHWFKPTEFCKIKFCQIIHCNLFKSLKDLTCQMQRHKTNTPPELKSPIFECHPQPMVFDSTSVSICYSGLILNRNQNQ